MKRLLSFASLVLLLTVASAQELEHFKGDLAALRKEAKKQKKVFFIDCYADWCGYCKKMDATTFSDPEVIKFVKKNFLSYKLNVEEGEGSQYARDNKISSLPTVQVYDYNGNLITSIKGYMDKERFFREMKKYVNHKAKPMVANVGSNLKSKNQKLGHFEGSLEELQQEAKKKKKVYFVDFYTTWCGYCKKMDATTFKDPQVVEMIKKNFISYKIDAEKGEGPSFARKHQVSGFPTIKIFDYNGNVIGTIRGYADKDRFIGEMQQYIDHKTAAGTAELAKEDYWEIKNPVFSNMDNSVSTFEGRKAEYLNTSYSNGKSKAYFEFEESLIDAEIDFGKPFLSRMKLEFERGKGNEQEVQKIVHTLFESGQLSNDELHYFSLYFVERNMVSIEVLQWINEVALKRKNDYQVLDTKAIVQLMFGDTGDAIETAKKAKKIASKYNLDATSSEMIIQLAKRQ